MRVTQPRGQLCQEHRHRIAYQSHSQSKATFLAARESPTACFCRSSQTNTLKQRTNVLWMLIVGREEMQDLMCRQPWIETILLKHNANLRLENMRITNGIQSQLMNSPLIGCTVAFKRFHSCCLTSAIWSK